ncbi:MAG: winged helix DNA-binding domain-containing protein, partial [Bacteroidota bacterium]|nr:winged helix DNA-binding domain-containing protein [Bacteroidota bacterium]
IDSQVYWFREEEQAPRPAERSVYLLPAFDEYIIGYKDRSACLAEKHRSKVISINGLFWPVIVINGMVTGLWKRRTTGGRAEVELQFFAKSFLSRNSELRADVAEAVREVGAFFRESSVVR